MKVQSLSFSDRQALLQNNIRFSAKKQVKFDSQPLGPVLGN